VIAYLDTGTVDGSERLRTLHRTPTFAGSGKTFISVLLIKDKYSELRRSEGRKVVVFLAPFVALVLQVCDRAPDRATRTPCLPHMHTRLLLRNPLSRGGRPTPVCMLARLR
jgi:hypothetical protein